MVDVAVCVPFLLDPLDLLGAPAALAASRPVPEAGGAARRDYLVFLTGADAPRALEAYIAARPEWRLEHQGGLMGTALVSLPEHQAERVQALRAQPFAAMVAPGGRAFCK